MIFVVGKCVKCWYEVEVIELKMMYGRGEVETLPQLIHILPNVYDVKNTKDTLDTRGSEVIP